MIPIANANEGVAMLETGSVDAYAGDKIKLVGLAAQAKEPAKLALLAEDLSFEPYALALPRNDSAYRLEVNRALTQVYMGGEIEPIFAAVARQARTAVEPARRDVSLVLDSGLSAPDETKRRARCLSRNGLAGE